MLLRALIASLLLAPAAAAQAEIELVDGKVITVRSISNETFTEVTYRTRTGGEGRKSADQVKKVLHDLSSPMLDDYVNGLEQMETRGDFGGAIASFNTVLADERLQRNPRLKWVQQHTLIRKARCMFSLADYAGVIESVDQLVSTIPDTFFYAPAQLLKAEALAENGKRTDAEGVYRDLSSAVSSKGLPDRWAAESELGLLLLDTSLKGESKKREVQKLVEKHRDKYPTVASRANVEIGNVMIEAKDFAGAQQFFRQIVDEGKADDMTIASAYSGLGDCAYNRGLGTEDLEAANKLYEEAVLAHLRVVTVYKEAAKLVPRSLYYAAMAYNRMGTDFNKRKILLASLLNKRFPNSPYNRQLQKDLNLKR